MMFKVEDKQGNIGKAKGITVIFSIYISVIPILQYYKSIIGGLNSATFIAVLFFLVFLFLKVLKRDFVYKIEKNLLPVKIFLAYITLNVIITTLYYNRGFNWDNLGVYFRMVLLFISLLIMGYKYFDKNIAIQSLGNILVLCAFLIFLQDILYYVFSIGIKFTISDWLMDPDYAIVINRFSGLFMEPAHFSQSAVLYLCFVIFDDIHNKNNKKQWKNIVIILGVVFSGSGQGYLMLFLLFTCWIIVSFRYKTITKTKFYVLILLVLAVPVVFLLLSKVSFVNYALSRIINEKGIFSSEALVGRTYTNFFFDNLDNTTKWLGVGFGHEYEVVNKGLYINSLFSYLIQCGYTWFLMMLIVLGLVFYRGDLRTKVFIPLYALSIYYATTASAMAFCFYILYLLPDRKMMIKNKTYLYSAKSEAGIEDLGGNING